MAEKENIFDSLNKTQRNIRNVLKFERDNHVTEIKGLTDYMHKTNELAYELKAHHSDLGSMVKDDSEKVLRLNAKINNMRDQMASLIEDKDISSNKELVGVLKQNSPSIPVFDDKTIMESKLNFYRSQYKNNMDHIEKGTNFLKQTKEAFARDGINVEDKEMQATFKKIGEAREKYIQSIKDQNKSKRIIGEKPKERAKFNLNEYTNYVENEVFGTAGNGYNRAIITYDRGNRQVERLKKIQNSLGEKIEGMIDKDGNFSYKKAVESSKMGWKGKAAIFGGVALGALALVGVASMVMSGGRQQNSNLYNPYQAMY